MLTQAFEDLAATPHFAPRAKRVIFLFQSGAPSQMDLFDYKPTMQEWFEKGKAADSPPCEGGNAKA